MVPGHSFSTVCQMWVICNLRRGTLLRVSSLLFSGEVFAFSPIDVEESIEAVSF